MDLEPAVSTKTCCASCGIEESDDIKLKSCTACKLVRYCSVKCQREHRPKHTQECKKRAAELHDEILFRQLWVTSDVDSTKSVSTPFYATLIL
ncbi:hypothetical protein QTG54_010622, partial [Skeletonema marinoi]